MKLMSFPRQMGLQADEFILGTQHTTHQQVKDKKQWK